MNELLAAANDVLAEFGWRPADVRLTPCRPGFSGAAVWRVASPAGPFALRAWPPEHPTEAGVRRIHRLMAHLRSRGFDLCPLPRSTAAGATYFQRIGRWWELTSWMEGEANYGDDPKPAKLAAACRVLAELHEAAGAYREPGESMLRHDASPGLTRRLETLRKLEACGLARLKDAMRGAAWREAAERGKRLTELFPDAARRVAPRLAAAARWKTSLPLCLRDVRAEHVLFVNDDVTGVIDFGAIAFESICGDIARLLGDMAGDDGERWRLGLGAYEAVRPLTAEQREMVGLFDASGVLLAGVNWLNWIFLKDRFFDDSAAVLARLDAILERLARLAA